MDVKEIAQKFYDYSLHIKGYSKETIRRYKYVIDLYRQYCQITNIKEVSEENVRSLFFHGRAQRNWSANTLIIFHKSLLVFLRWCMSQGYIDFNPVENIEKPCLEQKLPQKLTKQDSTRLLEIVYNYPYKNKFLSYRNYALFAMFVFAGLRKSELLNLRFADVDMENLAIFVSQGKGKKDRLVPISQTLAHSLRRYLEERKNKNITCPQFFASSIRNNGLTEDGLRHLVKRVQKAVGLKFSVHKLRHTFATLMLEGGCDIYTLSKMMGHSDIKTTTIYLSASIDHLRSQILKHPLN